MLPYNEWVAKKKREGTWLPYPEWKKRNRKINMPYIPSNLCTPKEIIDPVEQVCGAVKYFPISSVKGEAYIGAGAGKHLINSINNASHSIKIISPYVSEATVDKLVQKASLGVNVMLATSEPDLHINGFNVLRKLLKQNVHVDSNALNVKIHKQKVNQSLLTACIIAEVLFGYLALVMLSQLKLAILFATLAVLFIFVIIGLENSKQRIRLMRIRSFSYSTPFKVLKIFKPSIDMSLVHAKIYIIDDAIAYVGSFNYTVNGLNNNIEFVLEIKETESMQKIIEYVDEFFEAAWPESYTLNELGVKIYTEQYF